MKQQATGWGSQIVVAQVLLGPCGVPPLNTHVP
jgi:hypothetical protein